MVTLEHELHQRRLDGIRPRIDQKRPLTPSCLLNKQKQKFIRAEEQYEIFRKNQILMQKTYKIIQNSNQLHPKQLLQKKPPTIGSLNTKVRVDDLKKIWQENNRFLSKLQTIKTNYPINHLKQNARNNEKMKTNIQYNSNRFERNNFFLKLDKKGSVLGQSNQRVFEISSPITKNKVKFKLFNLSIETIINRLKHMDLNEFAENRSQQQFKDLFPSHSRKISALHDDNNQSQKHQRSESHNIYPVVFKDIGVNQN
ncbi:UNKNOWN [Stylonychia lemnae]|uniref:Uncharacterized protein n=1 Tax=Stylonychia lemnae TaxID=5949 RepID=A0A077ZV75_STYLE|nr:UNKNOWN [Stylonychia lemnae]|eukprot:CDW73205.1 UNKNOWN [Stylonychia lemnae]